MAHCTTRGNGPLHHEREWPTAPREGMAHCTTRGNGPLHHEREWPTAPREGMAHCTTRGNDPLHHEREWPTAPREGMAHYTTRGNDPLHHEREWPTAPREDLLSVTNCRAKIASFIAYVKMLKNNWLPDIKAGHFGSLVVERLPEAQSIWDRTLSLCHFCACVCVCFFFFFQIKHVPAPIQHLLNTLLNKVMKVLYLHRNIQAYCCISKRIAQHFCSQDKK